MQLKTVSNFKATANFFNLTFKKKKKKKKRPKKKKKKKKKKKAAINQ